jgi:hypothetical protein
MYNACGIKMNDSVKSVLAVDWGRKRLGLAVSDPTCTLARPLGVLKHFSRREDAEKILEIAQENNVGMIIIGVTYDDNHTPTHKISWIRNRKNDWNKEAENDPGFFIDTRSDDIFYLCVFPRHLAAIQYCPLIW